MVFISLSWYPFIFLNLPAAGCLPFFRVGQGGVLEKQEASAEEGVNLQNMADRSIAKYLKQEVSKVMTGLNEEAGKPDFRLCLYESIDECLDEHPWLWLMYKQTVASCLQIR